MSVKRHKRKYRKKPDGVRVTSDRAVPTDERSWTHPDCPAHEDYSLGFEIDKAHMRSGSALGALLSENAVPRASINTHLHQSEVDNLLGRLGSLDLRIARMRALHVGSSDPLAHRLIGGSIAERAEIQAKLAVR
jgi:hypothetical protein